MQPGAIDHPGDYIDGHFQSPESPDGELSIAGPADLDRRVARHSYALSQLHAAVDAARRATRAFRRTTVEQRVTWLQAYKARLGAHRDAIAETIAHEVGKPLWEARIEADALAKKVDLCIGAGSAYTRTEHIEALPAEIHHRPLGVIAILGPFNFPGHLPNGQLVPALLAGNTVVHKPSERAPSTGAWLARCLHEAGLPAGAFNLVQGPATTGQALCAHDDVDAIFFTGSTAAGRAIAADNAHRLGRVVALELGGKNASIVLDDCDLERTARMLAFAAYATAGQRCTSTSRVIATRGVADALARRLSELARGIRVGYPFDDDVFMGPVISADARARLLAAQADAVAAGFEPLVPSRALQPAGRRGHYVSPGLHRAPTTGPTTPARIPSYSDAELFGPDIALYTARDPEHAVELANDTRFGLIASVFTASEARFRAAAEALRVGVIHHNRATAGASGRLPFGGIGDSGNHRPAGILAGATCTHPVGVLLRPAPTDRADPPPSWPGLSPDADPT